MEKRVDTLSRVATELSKLSCHLSEKGPTLKGKNLLPVGANSFLFEKTPFRKGTGVEDRKRSHKSCVLYPSVRIQIPILLSQSTYISNPTCYQYPSI